MKGGNHPRGRGSVVQIHRAERQTPQPVDSAPLAALASHPIQISPLARRLVCPSRPMMT